MGYNVFAVTPSQNSDNRNDATGAFIPGAQRIAKAYRGAFRTFNNASSNTKKNFLDTIRDGPGSLDMFCYFGHGSKGQLGSAKIYNDKDMDQLAEVLKQKLNPGGVIVLYACSAGMSNGFSTNLQAKIGRDCWIYGHTSVGHSFANPDVSEVQQSRSPGYRDLFRGELRAAWSEALHYTDMWLRFPLMWDEYIERELNAIRLLGSWTVPGGKSYIFTWSRQNGTYDTLDSLNTLPVGQVEDRNGKRKGTWVVDRRLEITWDSGDTETWSMPIKPGAQEIHGTFGFATRTKHTLAGKQQT
jgi:hypothetical protein